MNMRKLNINDDLSQYLRVVGVLNSSGVLVNNVEIMKSYLTNRPSNIITYVMELEGNIVATATILLETKLRYTNLCCHIEDVAVDKKHRGKGYGRSMVEYVMKQAYSMGCYKIKLNCSDDNVGFYKKLGFYKSSNGMEISNKNG